MKMIKASALAAAGSLLLTGCLWSPGKFTSGLDIRADGSFSLAYKGEIVVMMPDDTNPRPWNDSMATCETEEGESRDCAPGEIAEQKAEHEEKEAERVANKKKEQEEMAAAFGFPGFDDASARRFAESLSKYEGWQSVSYRGKGVYDVDYRISGKLTQDYVFPLLPDTDLVLPFIAIRKRADGAVLVTAPALSGGEGPFAARAMMMGLNRKSSGGPDEMMRAEGRFTITTDGEILTNNTENGPTSHARGRALVWDVSPSSTKMPEALIRLK